MNATVWRDQTDDLWVFSADGDAWMYEPLEGEWAIAGTRDVATDMFGPMIEVALDDGDLIGLPPAPDGAE